MNVGELREYLEGMDPALPVVIDIPGPELFLHLESEHIYVTTGQGRDDQDQLEISWEPAPRRAT